MVGTNKSSTFASLLRKQGAWAGRLGNGLQNRVEQFDSARHLTPAMNFKIHRCFFISILFENKPKQVLQVYRKEKHSGRMKLALVAEVQPICY